MKASCHGLKVAKSSTGYYVGRFFQEDEAITQFVRLTDDFSNKQEASSGSNPSWKKSQRGKRGTEFSLFSVILKSVPYTMENSRLTPGIVSLALLCSK